MAVQTKHYTVIQKLTVYFKKRSRNYEKEGYRHAVFINNQYLMERSLAFCLDTSVMLSTILIWQLLMLFIISNILSVRYLNIIQLLTFGLLIISSFLFNSLIIIKTKGQTIGKYIYDLKVVGEDKHEVSSSKLAMRELFGFAVPFVVLSFFYGIVGVMSYWVLNLLFLIVHPKKLSFIDMFLGTRIVVLRKAEVVEEVKQPLPLYNTIDLHMHSNFSDDGELNVEEIFQKASANGVKVISITDHNSAKANFIAERMSKLYHVSYIPGIEIDCEFEGKHLHILGYFIDYNSELYAHIENDNLAKEKKASLERAARFEKFSGLKLDVDALLKNNRSQLISAERIAQQVLNNPDYQNSPLLQPYINGSRSDMPYVNFYWDLFVKGKPCYVEMNYPSLEDVIDVIKLTNGVPVLAHAYQTLEDDINFIHKLIDKGVEGIEVFSTYHSKKQMAELLRIAKERQVFITAGSDFHGKNKPNIELGDTGCPLEAEYVIEQFIQYAKQTNQ